MVNGLAGGELGATLRVLDNSDAWYWEHTEAEELTLHLDIQPILSRN
jgi:hypothetical protein